MEEAMRSLTEPAREIPIVADKDVVVAGGGLTGVMAAVAAARAGADALLTERNGFLGGAGAMWLPIQGYVDCEGRQIVKGLGQEFIDRLRVKGGADDHFVQCELHNPFLIIEPEAVKLVCLEMLEEAGVELYLQTWATNVHCEGERLRAVIVENKSGREAIAGDLFVDTTGDGDIAAWCGAPFRVGREKDEIPQSATLTFRLDGVDTEILRRRLFENPERYELYVMPRQQFRTNRRHALVGLKTLIDEARAEGYEGVPVERVIYCTLLDPGAVLVNMTKAHRVKGHDARDLTRAEVETRKQVPIITEFLRRYVPGFEDARLAATANQVGIRETRHIEGDYTLTIEDVKAGRRFSDAIAAGGYPIDIHNPTGGEVRLTRVPAYGIPYRCLTPKRTENVLVAGRSFSATHEALASARVMATCMAMGQAAGEAAAWAVREECSTRQVEVPDLQARLRANGAFLIE
jgi:hypothetical protein